MKKKANIILAGVIILFFICLTMIIHSTTTTIGNIFNEAPTSESYTTSE